FGGIENRFVRYDIHTGTYDATELPGVSDVWTLYPSSSQQWLLGSRQGLLSFDTRDGQLSSFVQYNQFSELAQAHILHIAPDRQGQLWICANTGLYTLDPQKGIIARYW